MANFLKGSLQDELDQFFQALHKCDVAIRKVSRSAICQARRKLSHSVFIDLLDRVCSLIDQHGPTLDYKGMRVFSIDGSTFRLPNQKAFVQEFGYSSTKHMTSPKVLARFSILHDVLNRVTYDAILDGFKNGENALAYQHLEETALPANSLIVLDRNYADYLLLRDILDRGHQFCVRLKKNLGIYREFAQLNAAEAILSYKPPHKVRREIGKDHPFAKPCKVRVLRIPNGKDDLILMTSLVDVKTFPAIEVASIYRQRWEIEESYKVKKCRMRIEDISGTTPEIARQDFHAKVFAETVTAAMLLEHHEQIEQDNLNKKNDYKISFTQALAKMKNVLPLLFLRPRQEPLLKDLVTIFLQCLVDIVPGRSHKRKTTGKNRPKMQTQSLCYRYNR